MYETLCQPPESRLCPWSTASEHAVWSECRWLGKHSEYSRRNPGSAVRSMQVRDGSRASWPHTTTLTPALFRPTFLWIPGPFTHFPMREMSAPPSSISCCPSSPPARSCLQPFTIHSSGSVLQRVIAIYKYSVESLLCVCVLSPPLGHQLLKSRVLLLLFYSVLSSRHPATVSGTT